MNKRIFLVISLIIISIILVSAGCNTQINAPPQKMAKLNPNEEDPYVWGKFYPRQYDSFMQNKEESKTEFGGSVRESHLDKKPYLRDLFKGNGFGEDYNEERGHFYSATDVKEIKRITPKSVASCWNCKTPTAPKQIAKEGISWYKKPFASVTKDVKHSISCWDCHDPKTMNLRVTRQNMINAFKRQGKDVNASPRNEMRTYVCAQCHNEYYFEKDTKEVINPWDKGLTPQDILAYYDEKKFSDWKHPQSETELIKMQHPEYEMFSGSVHQTSGVACADCHMPYVREGVEKYSSHWMTSPVKNLDVSCKPCHRQTTEWLKERIHDVQVRTNENLDIAGKENVRAIKAIQAAANSPDVDTAKLQEARNYHRTGQAYWDWVAAENSMGFHNSTQALHTLGLAINNARQAQVLAAEAAGKPLNPSMVDIPKKQTDQVGEPKKPEDKVKVPKQP